MRFGTKDLFSSILAGLETGFIAWGILEFLDVRIIPNFWLVVIVPVLWIAGVNLGYLLGRRLKFFNQFGKFAAIGFTNAAVDFGVLYYLIYTTGITSGVYYAVFKAVSFLTASVHSYLWNKFWVFEATVTKSLWQEMAKFFAVSVSGAVVNVAVASAVVNFIPTTLSPQVWAGVGAAAGSATALIWSFIGFRIIVFKK